MMLFFASCSKNNDDNVSGDVIMVNVGGIENSVEIKPINTTDGSKASTANSSMFTKSSIGSLGTIKLADGIFLSTSVDQYLPIKQDLSKEGSVNAAGNTQGNGLMAATSPMTQGFLYRLILFQNGAVHSTKQGASGTSLAMPVTRGETYDWAIYSYNSLTVPPSAGVTVGATNPTMPTPRTAGANILNQNGINDLVYANGTITIPTSGAVPPLDALLKQKLAKVYAEYNAKQHPNYIRSLSGSMINQDGSETTTTPPGLGGNYFQEGTLNLRTGVISNPTYYATGGQNFHRPNSTDYDIWRTTKYFTVGTTNINPLIIKMTAINMTPDAGGATVANTPSPPLPIITSFNITPVIGSTTVLNYTLSQ